MTTSDLVKALRICFRDLDDGADCPNCPLYGNENCLAEVMGGAADLIEQLTAENVIFPDGEESAIETLRKEIAWMGMVIALAQRKQAEAEAERDALREKAPQWISVEDRLPEVWKNERTGELVNYIVRSPYFGVDIGNYHKEAGTWLCMGLPCTVTHWMSLPEAPEGGEKA